MTITAGSLFTGIGGIDLAFSLVGADILFQVENDPFCQQVLTRHKPRYWRNARLYGDIRTVTRDELPRVDILFGGFPCQDISSAGNGAGIREGNRSGLWFEFARLIDEIRPRAVLLENVAAITVAGRGGDRVIADLTQMGYDTQWGIVSASDVGAPHQRERWFCVGYTHSIGQSSPHPPQRTLCIPAMGQFAGSTVREGLHSPVSAKW